MVYCSGLIPNETCLYAMRFITWSNEGAVGSIRCTAYATTAPASAWLCSPVAWLPWLNTRSNSGYSANIRG